MLKRTKPLKRGVFLRRMGKVGRRKLMARKNAKGYFWNHHDPRCRICEIPFIAKEDCAMHHKLKRSLGGPDSLENMVGLCHNCHTRVHQEPDLYEKVRDNPANVINGFYIELKISK